MLGMVNNARDKMGRIVVRRSRLVCRNNFSSFDGIYLKQKKLRLTLSSGNVKDKIGYLPKSLFLAVLQPPFS